MAYAVIRTDLMSGTNQPADLVSLRFYDTGNSPKEVENGVIAKLEALETGEREIWKAKAAASTDDLNNCVVIAGVETMYDEHKKNLDEYINEKGKVTRGYILRSRNIFSVTKEAFVSGVPTVGKDVGIGENGKIDADSGTGLGKCVAIDNTGRYTYYAIQIGKTESTAAPVI